MIGGALIIGENISSRSQSSSNQKSNQKNPSSLPPSKPNNDNPPSSPNQSPKPTPPQPIPKPDNSSEKKILASLIKTDLQEKIKNASEKSLKSYHELIGGNIYISSDNEEIKRKIKKTSRADEGREISPNDFEPEDWKEIVDLVRQMEKLEREKHEQKEQERKDKLNQNPQLFYYSSSGSTKRNGTIFYFKNFLGKRNGVDFCLYIHENHPTLTNIGSHFDKTESEKFYLISGFTEPTVINEYNHYEWFCHLSDKISLTPANF